LRGKQHAFLRAASGTFTAFDGPRASITAATGINDAGQIVGWYGVGPLENNENHGFVRAANGVLTTINVNVPGSYGTTANGINNAGLIVGDFTARTASNTVSCVPRRVPLRPSTFPGRTDVDVTASGINHANQVVGWFVESHDQYHGFVTTR